MRDTANTGPALGSEAVDAEFWALICGDEELLRTEFDGIVSEPAEHPTSPPTRTVIVLDRPDRLPWSTAGSGPTRRWIAQPRSGRMPGHERSPPGRSSVHGLTPTENDDTKVVIDQA